MARPRSTSSWLSSLSLSLLDAQTRDYLLGVLLLLGVVLLWVTSSFITSVSSACPPSLPGSRAHFPCPSSSLPPTLLPVGPLRWRL